MTEQPRFEDIGEALSTDLLEWAATAGRHARRDGDALVMANTGGELRWYLRDVDGQYELTFAERSEAERPVLWAESLVVIERFLSAELGQVIRSMQGLARIVLPWRTRHVAPGFSLIDLGDRRLRLDSTSGGEPVTFHQQGSPEPAVEYSYYATVTPRDVRGSYADPAGLPLFGDFLAV